MEQSTEKKEPIFKELSADDSHPEVTEVESLCVDCENTGMTRLLLTKIPFFKDVVLSSFECEHCGNKNNDIQPTEAVQDKGIKITTKIKSSKQDNIFTNIKKLTGTMQYTLFLLCIIPFITGMPLMGEKENEDDATNFTSACIEHLHTSCVKQLSPREPVAPSFETCGVAQLLDCFETEMNSSVTCRNINNNHPTRDHFVAIKLDFVNATACPPAEEIDHIIESLVNPVNQSGRNCSKNSTVLEEFVDDLVDAGENHGNEANTTEGQGLNEFVDGFTDGFSDEDIDGNAGAGEDSDGQTMENGDGEDHGEMPDYGMLDPWTLGSETGEDGKAGDKMSDLGNEDVGNGDSKDDGEEHAQENGKTEDDGKVGGTKQSTDLNRKVVKQASASFSIPELDFGSEAFTQKGALTTVEGLLQNAIDGLEQQQPVRRITDPEVAQKIDDFVSTLKTYCSGEKTFTLIIEDISGNSFVENRDAPRPDLNMQIEHFTRTREQNNKLGLAEEQVDEERKLPYNSGELDLSEEVLQFPTNCSSCQSPATTNMKLVRIPHFKEVIIMATNCDYCGYRTNEVKSGGGVEPLGLKITLKMTKILDLSRDLLKSETCDVSIPELELEIRSGTIGGKFTTVEGLLCDFKDQIQTLHPFIVGDSSSEDNKKRLKVFIDKLDKYYSRSFNVNHAMVVNNLHPLVSSAACFNNDEL
eukprot:gene11232-12411_t